MMYRIVKEFLYKYFILQFISKLSFRLIFLVLNISNYYRCGLKKIISHNKIKLNTVEKKWFILGTGPSVNEYSEKQWKEIKTNYSCGINKWIYHKVVTNFYFFEIIGDVDWMLKELIKNKSKFKNSSLIVKGNYLHKSAYNNLNININRLTATFKNNLYAALDIPIPDNSPENFRKSIELLKKFGYFKKNSNFPVFIHSKATLSECIIMGIKLGFKDIVLCGIDLGSEEHFFCEEVNSKRKNIKHPTEISTKSIKISEVIYIISELLEENGLRLWVGSTKSELYPKIPLYKWN